MPQKVSRVFKCTHEDCHSSFQRPNKLKAHMLKHSDNYEKPHKCDEPGCGKTYTSSSHLIRHKSSSHTEKEIKKIPCTYKDCHMLFSNPQNLKRHLKRTHIAYTCKDCNESFNKKFLLRRHSILHTDEPYYKCDICEKKFESVAAHNKHKRNHKTYPCSKCDKQFGKWSLLRSHMLEHPTIFKCSECDYETTHKGMSRAHKQVHVDLEKRPTFQCTYEGCSKTYLYKPNLNYHVKVHHLKDKRKFSCTFENCNKQFAKKVSLQNHLDQHNGKVVEKPKMARKIRCDAGKPKTSVLGKLVGNVILKDLLIIKESEEKLNKHGPIMNDQPINQTESIKQGVEDIEQHPENPEIAALNFEESSDVEFLTTERTLKLNQERQEITKTPLNFDNTTEHLLKDDEMKIKMDAINEENSKIQSEHIDYADLINKAEIEFADTPQKSSDNSLNESLIEFTKFTTNDCTLEPQVINFFEVSQMLQQDHSKTFLEKATTTDENDVRILNQVIIPSNKYDLNIDYVKKYRLLKRKYKKRFGENERLIRDVTKLKSKVNRVIRCLNRLTAKRKVQRG